MKNEPPETPLSSSRASPPQSSLRADSSPIEGEQVALAIEDHYRPLGPNDRVPSDPVTVTLALADKLDTLVAFWVVANERPTGSSDPYALRRAALGVVRIVRAAGVRIAVGACFREWMDSVFPNQTRSSQTDAFVLADLLAFLADRLKVQLRDQGKRHDLVDAVFALGDDDLVRIVTRVEALDAFLKTQDGANLLSGYKRAANILAAEEKKGKWSAEEGSGVVDSAKLAEPAEEALHAALEAALPAARVAVEKGDFAAAMKALSGLRAPVDEFFEKVLVNSEDASVRRNRLLLLTRFREALSAVADFSKIEG
ncbi:MAG: glycine--tRNA ligase subunit beta [Terricaulis sp.]